MDYRKEWCFGGDKRSAGDAYLPAEDDFITAYVAENGKRIECQYGWNNARIGYKFNGEFYHSLREAKAALEAIRIPSSAPEFGKGLTADERALIDEYLEFHNSMTLEVYDLGHGTYSIEDEYDTYEFSSAAELIADIKNSMREYAKEASAEACDAVRFLRLTADEYGYEAYVAIEALNLDVKLFNVVTDVDGNWQYWAFIGEVYDEDIATNAALVEYLCTHDDLGGCDGGYSSFKSIVEDPENDGYPLLHELYHRFGGEADEDFTPIDVSIPTYTKRVTLFELLQEVNGKLVSVTYPCPMAWIIKGLDGERIDGINIIARVKTLRTNVGLPTHTRCKVAR